MANASFGVNILPKNNTVTIGNSDSPWTIVSPSLTGIPTAPTAEASTNTTQIATTAFVKSSALSDIEYDTTNKKITKTLNGTTIDVVSASDLKTDMSLSKNDVGLSNVDNKSSATIRSEITSSNVTTALGFTPIDSTEKGSANGVAELDSNGKVPSSQLPSFVDDVIEYDAADFTEWTEWVASTSYAVGDKVKVTDNSDVTGYICNTANSDSTFDPDKWDEATCFPAEGESGKIYIALDTNKTYRWGGSTYVTIGSSLALGETSSTAYRGDRGAAAYAAAVTNVDSTPTANSTNLVTSGGVASAISEFYTKPSDGIPASDLASGVVPDVSGLAPKAYPEFTGGISLARKSGTSTFVGSIAVGTNTEASASYAAAFNEGTAATGQSAFAEGCATIASAPYSHAEGLFTVANHKSQHVGGERNVADPSTNSSSNRGTYVEIIGNGTGQYSLSNARALDWDGNERLKGDLYVGCNADSTGGTKVVTVNDVSSLTRQFYSSTDEMSLALSANGRTYMLTCVGSTSGTSGAIADTTYGALIIISNGDYIVVHKGSAIVISEDNSTLTITSSSNIKMAIVEL